MIRDPELTEVVFPGRDPVPGSPESKRQKTAETLLNILQGRVRNKNTRSAYKAAWRSFFEFCSEYKLQLDRVKPYHFDMWLKRHRGSVATQRQHLSAIRLLFDELLKQGVVEHNPAARAKPPRLERERSHTTVFEEDEIKAFLGSIEPDSLIGIRDKALFNVLLYGWARVSALVALKVEDYYQRKGDCWLRLQEKRGKIHEVPVHSKAREAIDRWLDASGLRSKPSAPLFPAFGKDKKTIELKQDKKTLEFIHMDRTGIWKLVQARARVCGLKKRVGCHSFRATGITEYMNAGGALDIAQRIAGHAQLSTTKIYDRSQDRVTMAEIERLSFELSSEATTSG
jgi:integrase/recombinase XerD